MSIDTVCSADPVVDNCMLMRSNVLVTPGLEKYIPNWQKTRFLWAKLEFSEDIGIKIKEGPSRPLIVDLRYVYGPSDLERIRRSDAYSSKLLSSKHVGISTIKAHVCVIKYTCLCDGLCGRICYLSCCKVSS